MEDVSISKPATETPKSDTRIIKRYANRKLYDTRDSRYVTLNQIAEFVKIGEDVKIIDNNSKDDLTTITLAQIIYEQEKNGEAETRDQTIGTLRHFIQVGGQKLMESLREGPVGKLIPKREDGTDAAPKVESTPPVALAEEKKRSIMDKSREALDELQRVTDDRVRSLIASAIAPVQHLQSEVKRLQARIDELESTLVKASQPRSVPPKPSNEKEKA